MVRRSPSGANRHRDNKAKTRNSARARARAEKRPEFVAVLPKGLTPKQADAWERAAKKANGDAWTPSGQGDFVTGTLVSADSVGTKFGSKRVLVLKDGKTLHRVFCGTVLEKEYESLMPEIGEELLILYQGEVASGKGHPAKLFSMVRVDPKAKRG